MKKLLAILITLCTFNGWAQNNIAQKISINWSNNPNISKPYFNDVYYFDSAPNLPYYFKIYNIPANKTFASVEISKTQFLAKNRYQHLLSDSVPPNVKFKHKIVYTQKQKQLYVWFNAAINASGQYNLVSAANLNIKLKAAPEKNAQKKYNRRFANNSVLKDGKWRKIKLKKNGIYKITYNQLINWGFENPAQIRIYGFGGKQLSFRVSSDDPYNLPEVPLKMNKGNDGIFNSGDYVLFYGQGIENRHTNINSEKITCIEHDYTRYGHYFITTKSGNGARIPTTDLNSENHNSSKNTFTDVAHINFRKNNLNHTGRIFFSDILQPGETKSFNFSFPDIVASEPVRIDTRAGAICSGVTSYIDVKYNGQTITQISIPKSSDYHPGRTNTQNTYADINEDQFSLSMKYRSNNVSAQGYIGHITLTALREIIYKGNQLLMHDLQNAGSGNIIKYKIENMPADGQIWHVTNAGQPENMALVQNGQSTSFKFSSAQENRFIVFEPANIMTPIDAGNVENQNLHSSGFYDLFIITHPLFRSQAEELAQFHRDHDAMRVMVVEPQKIYNEFSSGNQDVSAIRNFLKMFYDRATTEADMPKNVLLFGDGSYDNISTENNTNYIPTFETKIVAGASSVACDDFFVMLDEGEGGDEFDESLEGTLDAGIGRFPVNSTRQANILLNKTLDYIKNPNLGPWKNRIIFVGDDADGGDYYLQTHANELAEKVREKYKWMNTKQILMDAYPQESTPAGERYPEVTKAINSNIHQGALIFNYTGHGSETRLAHEAILTKNTVKNWSNDKLPFFMTGSCEISRFDNKNEQSLGETILLHENGGAITLFSTTRVVWGNANQNLSRNFYDEIFKPTEEGTYKTLGQLIAKTKNITQGSNMRNFTLFGNPAMQLDVPPKRVVTDSLNGIAAQNEPDTVYTDTMKALKKISVYGHIEDSSGNMKNNFNGTIYPIIYDKIKGQETLNNDNSESGTFTYYEYSNIIYKGKATVQNGTFRFEFIVPIDINYEMGTGKISYYADNSLTDAYGFFDNFMVGGSDSLITDDNQGPEIELFLNDTTFINGGTTDESPLLLAHIRDQYGLNTTGNVIGHDLTATLNNNRKNKIILNDFFENDLNSYQSGKVEYQLIDMNEGLNTIKMKAWDVLNNPSEAYIEFVVANSQEIALNHVLNYPNPFTTKTKFLFEHNQASQIINVRIQIYTVSGKLIKTLETSMPGTQYTANPIVWDGRDDFGDKIGRGVYIYKVRLSTPDGKSKEKFEKLVILR